MKKTYSLLIAFCISSFAFCIEYPMPANGSIYGFVNPDFGGNTGYANLFSFKSDTVINKLTYQTWKNSNLISRNDSNRVYIWEDQKERLLYDFNLVKGDSIVIESYTYKVTSADSITMKNGQRRKAIDLEYKGYMQSYYYHWVEGIGDLFGGFLYFRPGLNVETFGLICYCDASGLVYQTWKDVTCENVGLIGKVSSSNISPTESILFLNGSIQVDSKLEFSAIQLFDVAGKKVLESTQSEFSVRDLPSGLYYVLINLKDGKMITRDIVLK